MIITWGGPHWTEKRICGNSADPRKGRSGIGKLHFQYGSLLLTRLVCVSDGLWYGVRKTSEQPYTSVQDRINCEQRRF